MNKQHHEIILDNHASEGVTDLDDLPVWARDALALQYMLDLFDEKGGYERAADYLVENAALRKILRRLLRVATHETDAEREARMLDEVIQMFGEGAYDFCQRSLDDLLERAIRERRQDARDAHIDALIDDRQMRDIET